MRVRPRPTPPRSYQVQFAVLSSIYLRLSRTPSSVDCDGFVEGFPDLVEVAEVFVAFFRFLATVFHGLVASSEDVGGACPGGVVTTGFGGGGVTGDGGTGEVATG